MNSNNFSDYIIVGIISMVTSFFIINIIITNKEKKKNLNNIKTYIITFCMGLIIHGFTEYFKITEWYCDKRCMTAIKLLSI